MELPPKVSFVATVGPVLEVSLLVRSAATPWDARLAGSRLTPWKVDGQVELSISATRFRWAGLLTRELVIGFPVSHRGAVSSLPGLYLVHAFNRLPALAWMERTFFSTPYWPARFDMDDGGPPRLRVEGRQGTLFSAGLDGQRNPVQQEAQCWQGPIFLPGGEGFGEGDRVFFARLEGETAIYPFLPDRDTFSLDPGDVPALKALVSGGLEPVSWLVRRNAVHARSRTYSCAQVPGLE